MRFRKKFSFPGQIFCLFPGQKHIVPMFYQYCDYIFGHFLHDYTLKPNLSHFKKESVKKPCRFTSFVLVISNDPRIRDLNIYYHSLLILLEWCLTSNFRYCSVFKADHAYLFWIKLQAVFIIYVVFSFVSIIDLLPHFCVLLQAADSDH